MTLFPRYIRYPISLASSKPLPLSHGMSRETGTEAVRVYQSCHAALSSELGIEPPNCGHLWVIDCYISGIRGIFMASRGQLGTNSLKVSTMPAEYPSPDVHFLTGTNARFDSR